MSLFAYEVSKMSDELLEIILMIRQASYFYRKNVIGILTGTVLLQAIYSKVHMT